MHVCYMCVCLCMCYMCCVHVEYFKVTACLGKSGCLQKVTAQADSPFLHVCLVQISPSRFQGPSLSALHGAPSAQGLPLFFPASVIASDRPVPHPLLWLTPQLLSPSSQVPLTPFRHCCPQGPLPWVPRPTGTVLRLSPYLLLADTWQGGSIPHSQLLLAWASHTCAESLLNPAALPAQRPWEAQRAPRNSPVHLCQSPVAGVWEGRQGGPPHHHLGPPACPSHTFPPSGS